MGRDERGLGLREKRKKEQAKAAAGHEAEGRSRTGVRNEREECIGKSEEEIRTKRKRAGGMQEGKVEGRSRSSRASGYDRPSRKLSTPRLA